MFSSVNSYRPLGSTGWENEVSWNLSNFINLLHCDLHLLYQPARKYTFCFLLNINKIKISSFVYWCLFHIKCPLKNTLGKKEYSVMRFYFDFSTFVFLQELIPLILCTACLHPEPKERDQLLHILFNLIKRPDDEQRYV